LLSSRKRHRGQIGSSKTLRPLYKTIDDLLLAGHLEGDGELVAADLHHVAITEFLVKYAVIKREFGFRNQFAFDGQRAALGAARCGIASRDVRLQTNSKWKHTRHTQEEFIKTRLSLLVLACFPAESGLAGCPIGSFTTLAPCPGNRVAH